MRQQIAVGNVIGNHTMIEAWRANSWVPPGGEDTSDAEPSPRSSGGAGGGRAAYSRSRATSRHLMTLRGYLFHALIRF